MQTTKKTVYEIITDRILDELKNGVCPWQKPWKGGSAGVPANLKSKKNYRGINVWVLGLQRRSSRYWLTFNQARQMGGAVRKGEHGTPVVFWKAIDKKKKTDVEADDDTANEKYFLLRYYTVFNLDQIDGIDAPDQVTDGETADFEPIEICENIVDQMPKRPEIKHNEARAYYRPDADFVNMPKAELFNKPAEYYSTIFHELTHATGHKSRLDRDGITNLAAFGDEVYSKEELVAEMGAAFLCGHAGIENETINNSAAYIDGWLKKLSGDPKLVVFAAAQAQKAADFILGNNQNN